MTLKFVQVNERADGSVLYVYTQKCLSGLDKMTFWIILCALCHHTDILYSDTEYENKRKTKWNQIRRKSTTHVYILNDKTNDILP